MKDDEPEDPMHAFMRGEEITHISGEKIRLPKQYIEFMRETISGGSVGAEMKAFIEECSKERRKYVSLKRTVKTLEDLLVKERIFNGEMHDLLEHLEKENESLKRELERRA